ncbi:MAG: DUF1707 SHOCT-like domain-containing protein [Marmoricola sp.]
MADWNLRIGDAEREAASTALGEHFAAGRLTQEEYAERNDAVWTACTRGDLETLFTDLPRADRASQRPGTQSRRRVPAFPLVPVLVGLVVLTAVTHVPFILLGLLAWLLLRRRGWWRRSDDWAGPWGGHRADHWNDHWGGATRR